MKLVKQLSFCLLFSSLALGATACGDDGGGDGQMTVDPAGTHTQFVINEATVPANAAAAANVAQDIDGDDLPDNALGGLLGSLATTADLDLQTGIDSQLAEGGFILLASIKATDLTNANGVGTWIFFGDNPNPTACTDENDMVCGKHFSGSASFDLSSTSPTDAVLVGQIVNGQLKGGPGDVSIELPLGETEPLRLDLVSARLEVTASASGLMSGKLGGAVTSEDVDNEIMPTVADMVANLIADYCTPVGADCGCEAGSAGESVLNFFDEDGSCDVPLAELMENSLIDSTIRNPDLDLYDAEGKFNPNKDGVKDALSIGIGFGAVGASFTLPAGVE